MWKKKWRLFAVYGFLLAFTVSNALKATRPKFKIASSTSTPSTLPTIAKESFIVNNSDDEVEITTIPPMNDTNLTLGHVLTGIPQIDYIWDPNLPRELNGYNLSDYPFYSSMPEDIDFKCDGLHDGFYASVPHKCQVYHHCLFGTRYDFLCANFTAFDQKTFICHFVSEVDCANSKKFWHRNDALYKAITTTSLPPSTTTVIISSKDKTEKLPSRERDSPVRRRRPSVRRPSYDYYYEDYYDDDDYDRIRSRGYNRREYDDYEDRKFRRDRERDLEHRHRNFRDRDRNRYLLRSNRRDPSRTRDNVEEETVKQRIRDQDFTRTRNDEESMRENDEAKYSDKRDDYDEKESVSSSFNNSNPDSQIRTPLTSVYARPRIPPKIRRPVPLHEQEKYSYSTGTTIRSFIDESRRRTNHDVMEESPSRSNDNTEEVRHKPSADTSNNFQKKHQIDILDDTDDYYDEDFEEVRPRWLLRSRPLRDRETIDKRYQERPSRIRYRKDDDYIRWRNQRSKERVVIHNKNFDRNPDYSLDQVSDRIANNKHNSERVPNSEKSKETLIYNRSHDQDNEESGKSIPYLKNYQEISKSSEQFDPYVTNITEKTIFLTTEESKKDEFQNSTEEMKNKSRDLSFINLNNRQHHYQNSDKNYSMSDFSNEFYDDIEDTTSVSISLPQTTFMKRPLLPSRGGNLNPRGLLFVGVKAQTILRHTENPIKHSTNLHSASHFSENKEKNEDELSERKKNGRHVQENKHLDNEQHNSRHRNTMQKQHVKDNSDTFYEKTNEFRQELDSFKKLPDTQESLMQLKISKEMKLKNTEPDLGENNRNINQHFKISKIKVKNNHSNVHNVLDEKNNSQEQSLTKSNLKIQPTKNFVTHHLQDIPENEFDVTLNEALTPNSKHESTFLNGFALPLHRQFNLYSKDTVLQSSDSMYTFLNPINQQDFSQRKNRIHQI